MHSSSIPASSVVLFPPKRNQQKMAMVCILCAPRLSEAGCNQLDIPESHLRPRCEGVGYPPSAGTSAPPGTSLAVNLIGLDMG